MQEIKVIYLLWVLHNEYASFEKLSKHLAQQNFNVSKSGDCASLIKLVILFVLVRVQV